MKDFVKKVFAFFNSFCLLTHNPLERRVIQLK